MPEACAKPRTTTRTPRAILSVPVSPAQRAELDRRAGAMPVAAYVREYLFAANDNARPRRNRSRKTTDRRALAAVLARLGQSEIAASLREMAHLAKLGALPMSPETEEALQQACRDVAAIKSLLMRALGIAER